MRRRSLQQLGQDAQVRAHRLESPHPVTSATRATTHTNQHRSTRAIADEMLHSSTSTASTTALSLPVRPKKTSSNLSYVTFHAPALHRICRLSMTPRCLLQHESPRVRPVPSTETDDQLLTLWHASQWHSSRYNSVKGSTEDLTSTPSSPTSTTSASACSSTSASACSSTSTSPFSSTSASARSSTSASPFSSTSAFACSVTTSSTASTISTTSTSSLFSRDSSSTSCSGTTSLNRLRGGSPQPGYDRPQYNTPRQSRGRGQIQRKAHSRRIHENAGPPSRQLNRPAGSTSASSSPTSGASSADLQQEWCGNRCAGQGSCSLPEPSWGPSVRFDMEANTVQTMCLCGRSYAAQHHSSSPVRVSARSTPSPGSSRRSRSPELQRSPGLKGYYPTQMSSRPTCPQRPRSSSRSSSSSRKPRKGASSPSSSKNKKKTGKSPTQKKCLTKARTEKWPEPPEDVPIIFSESITAQCRSSQDESGHLPQRSNCGSCPGQQYVCDPCDIMPCHIQTQCHIECSPSLTGYKAPHSVPVSSEPLPIYDPEGHFIPLPSERQQPRKRTILCTGKKTCIPLGIPAGYRPVYDEDGNVIQRVPLADESMISRSKARTKMKSKREKVITTVNYEDEDLIQGELPADKCGTKAPLKMKSMTKKAIPDGYRPVYYENANLTAEQRVSIPIDAEGDPHEAGYRSLYDKDGNVIGRTPESVKTEPLEKGVPEGYRPVYDKNGKVIGKVKEKKEQVSVAVDTRGEPSEAGYRPVFAKDGNVIGRTRASAKNEPLGEAVEGVPEGYRPVNDDSGNIFGKQRLSVVSYTEAIPLQASYRSVFENEGRTRASAKIEPPGEAVNRVPECCTRDENGKALVKERPSVPLDIEGDPFEDGCRPELDEGEGLEEAVEGVPDCCSIGNNRKVLRKKLLSVPTETEGDPSVDGGRPFLDKEGKMIGKTSSSVEVEPLGEFVEGVPEDFRAAYDQNEGDMGNQQPSVPIDTEGDLFKDGNRPVFDKERRMSGTKRSSANFKPLEELSEGVAADYRPVYDQNEEVIGKQRPSIPTVTQRCPFEDGKRSVSDKERRMSGSKRSSDKLETLEIPFEGAPENYRPVSDQSEEVIGKQQRSVPIDSEGDAFKDGNRPVLDKEGKMVGRKSSSAILELLGEPCESVAEDYMPVYFQNEDVTGKQRLSFPVDTEGDPFEARYHRVYGKEGTVCGRTRASPMTDPLGEAVEGIPDGYRPVYNNSGDMIAKQHVLIPIDPKGDPLEAGCCPVYDKDGIVIGRQRTSVGIEKVREDGEFVVGKDRPYLPVGGFPAHYGVGMSGGVSCGTCNETGTLRRGRVPPGSAPLPWCVEDDRCLTGQREENPGVEMRVRIRTPAYPRTPHVCSGTPSDGLGSLLYNFQYRPQYGSDLKTAGLLGVSGHLFQPEYKSPLEETREDGGRYFTHSSGTAHAVFDEAGREIGQFPVCPVRTAAAGRPQPCGVQCSAGRHGSIATSGAAKLAGQIGAMQLLLERTGRWRAPGDIHRGLVRSCTQRSPSPGNRGACGHPLESGTLTRRPNLNVTTPALPSAPTSQLSSGDKQDLSNDAVVLCPRCFRFPASSCRPHCRAAQEAPPDNRPGRCMDHGVFCPWGAAALDPNNANTLVRFVPCPGPPSFPAQPPALPHPSAANALSDPAQKEEGKKNGTDSC